MDGNKYIQNWCAIIFTIIIFTTTTTTAQEKRYYNVKNSQWTEINLIGDIGKKFEYQLDWQYRRQSQQVGYQPNANLTNIFLNPYRNVFKPWIHFYPLPSEKLRFSISPIGFWATYGLAGSNGTVLNGTEAPNDALLEYPEIRSSYQVATFDKIGRVKLTYRARWEFRWIGTGQPSTPAENRSGFTFFHGFPMQNRIHKYRLRIFARADIALQDRTIDPGEFYAVVANELWIGMGPKTASANFFDQNRAYTGLGFRTKSEIRFELGYLLQIVPQNQIIVNNSTTGRNIDWNNVLQFFVIFDNFNRFFEKKGHKEPNPLPIDEGF